MKRRLLHIALILSSFIGYLEWGEDQSMFLIQGEWDIILMFFSDPKATLHPLIWLPLFGQIMLLVAAVRKEVSAVWSWLGIAGVGILLYFMFVIGLLGGSWLTTLSATPFLVLSIWTVIDVRKGTTE